jgi:hypothetical protein
MKKNIKRILLSCLLFSSLQATDINLIDNNHYLSVGIGTEDSNLKVDNQEGKYKLFDNSFYKMKIGTDLGKINEYSKWIVNGSFVFNENNQDTLYFNNTQYEKEKKIDNYGILDIGILLNIEEFYFQLTGGLKYIDYEYKNQNNLYSYINDYLYGYQIGGYKKINKSLIMGLEFYNYKNGVSFVVEEQNNNNTYNLTINNYGFNIPLIYSLSKNISLSTELTFDTFKDNSDYFSDDSIALSFNFIYKY